MRRRPAGRRGRGRDWRRAWTATLLGGAVAGSAFLAGCAGRGPAGEPAARSIRPRFEEIAHPMGVRFRHTNGAAGNKWLPETMGSGAAFLDADQDGRVDLLLVDSATWTRPARGRTRLFRNLGGGRFVDVTERFGLPAGFYGMGAAVGDWDNDGYPDLCLTGVEGARLFHNERGRRFEEWTRRLGFHAPGWSTSAAWLDYDRDGRLDLFLCRYVKWSPGADRFYSLDGVHKSYARPDDYEPESCRLYRNAGSRFVDVSAAAGVDLPTAKALGVALCDFDRDGWVDLAVSNDTVPNYLFHNQGNGRFKEVAVQAGVAVAEGGRAKAGMGIDTADYLNDGQEAILITNFAGEQLTLYRRDPSGLFQDVAARVGIGIPSQQYLGFGVLFLDVDLDGWQDIFVANGHIQDDVARRNSGVTYAEPALLFFGGPEGRFAQADLAGDPLGVPRVGRGAACADIDDDGDLDLVVTTNGGPAALFRAAGRPKNHWLRLRLEGLGTPGRSNRSAIGAVVRVRIGDRVQTRMVRSGSSYLSQSDLRLTFGLGAAERVDEIEVRWPNGAVESFGPAAADRELHLVEGSGAGI